MSGSYDDRLSFTADDWNKLRKTLTDLSQAMLRAQAPNNREYCTVAMTREERAFVEAILNDFRTGAYKVLAITLKRENKDATVREVGEMSYSTPINRLGDDMDRQWRLA